MGRQTDINALSSSMLWIRSESGILIAALVEAGSLSRKFAEATDNGGVSICRCPRCRNMESESVEYIIERFSQSKGD